MTEHAAVDFDFVFLAGVLRVTKRPSSGCSIRPTMDMDVVGVCGRSITRLGQKEGARKVECLSPVFTYALVCKTKKIFIWMAFETPDRHAHGLRSPGHCHQGKHIAKNSSLLIAPSSTHAIVLLDHHPSPLQSL